VDSAPFHQAGDVIGDVRCYRGSAISRLSSYVISIVNV
jgi:hypothetical protein